VLNVNANKKPAAHFWYFPADAEGAVIMTGDDHANGRTAGRFDTFIADSPAGCKCRELECSAERRISLPDANQQFAGRRLTSPRLRNRLAHVEQPAILPDQYRLEPL